MATPVIASVSDQTFSAGVAVMLNVSITGIDISDTDHSVEVEGLLVGLYYNWNQTNNRVEIRGMPEALVSDVVFTITAINDDGTATRDVNWGVVPSAPVIEAFGPFEAARGLSFEEQIEIANSPSQINIEGGWAGLAGSTDRITGTVPEDAEFTKESIDVMVTAINDGGMDTESGIINIVREFSFYMGGNSGRVEKINTDGELVWSYEAGTGTYKDIQFGNGGVYFFDDTSDALIKLDAGDGSLLWTYNAASGTYDEIVVGDGAVYLFNETENDLIKVNDSDGSEAWTWDGDTGAHAYEPVVVGDGAVYVFNDTLNDLIKVNDSDGSEAWTYEASVTRNQLIYGGGSAYLFSEGGNNILEKIDDSDGTVEWTYTLTGFGEAFNNAFFHDGSVYTVGDRVRKINDSNGTLAWSYSPPSPQSVEYVVFAGDAVYVHSDTAAAVVHKVSLSSGTRQWFYSAQFSASSGWDQPVFGDDAIFMFADTAIDQVLKVGAGDGMLDWQVNASRANARLVYGDGALFSWSGGDQIIRYNAADGSEVWDYNGSITGGNISFITS